MTELEKAAAGFLYDANYDPQILQARTRCADLCFEFNQCPPSQSRRRRAILEQIVPGIPEDAVITAPFYCDYGSNIAVGKNFYTNCNCVILDGARVTFGDHVFIAPNCVFSTAGHPIDATHRDAGLEIALPITIGDSVWIGAGVIVTPGVQIGSGSIIGAGSVVTRDIPAGVVAAGSPCRVLRAITEEDRCRYPVFEEQ